MAHQGGVIEQVEIKERPILFSSEMVRAILEGRKTQTRRVVKHPEYYGDLTGDCPHWDKRECAEAIHKLVTPECPYGQPGERLWVREAWAMNIPPSGAAYRADGWEYGDPIKWKPSIFMPRWASRLTLEITQVRVERLQEITQEDAQAESFQCIAHFRTLWDKINGKPVYVKGAGFGGSTARCESGKSWNDNPWVWVIEFKRVA